MLRANEYTLSPGEELSVYFSKPLPRDEYSASVTVSSGEVFSNNSPLIGKDQFVFYSQRCVGFALTSGNESATVMIRENAPDGQGVRFAKTHSTAPGLRVDIHACESKAKELHTFLQIHRKAAANGTGSGPRVLVAGATDTGKSSLCKQLINLCVADQFAKFRLAYVDVDLGQNAISIPGSISTAFLNQQLPPDEEFAKLMPLSFCVGTTSLDEGESAERYLNQCSQSAQCMNAVFQQKPEYSHGGCIVNTMGWVTGRGLDILRQLVDLYQINVVVVTGSNKELADELKRLYHAHPRGIVVKMSGRVAACAVRDRTQRSAARWQQMHQYFYGLPSSPLAPSRVVVETAKVTILDSVTGKRIAVWELKPLTVCAVVHAATPEDALSGNVAGYIAIVRCAKTTVDLMSPSPGPLPSSILLATALSVRPLDVPMHF